MAEGRERGTMSHASKDPMHGVTLQKILEELVAHFGWDSLGVLVHIRCFNLDPSIKSSLVFLRRTPWARKKVETLYLEMIQKNKSA